MDSNIGQGLADCCSQEPKRPVLDPVIDQLRELKIELCKVNVSKQFKVSEQLDQLQVICEDLEHLKKVARASEALEIDYVHNYNYAFCGIGGSGKSSLINAFLFFPRVKGLRAWLNWFRSFFSREPPYPGETPKIGITECTMETKRYTNAKFPHLAFWDLPGAGTTSHPAETYYEDKALFAFDALLIILNDRITETDLNILKKAKEKQKSVIMLQNKCDSHLENMMRTNGMNNRRKAEEEFRKEKLIYLKKQLDQIGLQENDCTMLMVSSSFRYEMDEEKVFQFFQDAAAPRAHPLKNQ